MSGALSADRRRAMLRTAMGPTIAAALADPLVQEVMMYPDGALRLDRLGEGRSDTGMRYAPAQIERIIRLVARALPVHLIKIDMVGSEPAQTRLARLADVAARSLSDVGAGLHSRSPLGRARLEVSAWEAEEILPTWEPAGLASVRRTCALVFPACFGTREYSDPRAP